MLLVAFAKERRELAIIALNEAPTFLIPDISMIPSSGAHFKEKERNGHPLWGGGNSPLVLAGL